MYGKLFWKIGDSKKNVKIIPVPSPIEQFRVTEEKHKEGFRQIIITTEAMLKCIHVLEEEGYRLTNLEICDDNSVFKEGFSLILENNPEHLAFFVQVLENLDSLCMFSSNTVECAELMSENGNKLRISLSGLIESDDKIPSIIAETVKKCIFA